MKNIAVVGIASLLAAMLTFANSPAFADGETLYRTACFACHDPGIAGAPKLKDQAVWAPRIATGTDAMVGTVISGKGAMPPNGGTKLTENEIREVVEYMVSQSN